MIDPAFAASAASAASSASVASAAVLSTVDVKAILDWTFVIGSLDLAVFGYIYSAYVSARFSRPPPPPPIVDFLKLFCVVLVAVLFVLTALAIYTTLGCCHTNYSVWILVSCLGAVVLASAILVYQM